MKAFLLFPVILAASISSASAATELLQNGGFETGDFTGWTATTAPGSDGSIIVTDGDVVPGHGDLVLFPNEGTYHVVMGQYGQDAHALTQAFTVPFGITGLSLTFDLFAVSSGEFEDGPLTPIGVTSQHIRVDIMTAGADPFDIGAGVAHTVLAPFVDGSFRDITYTSYSRDLFGILDPGETYQLRFAEVSGFDYIAMGVDNVSLMAIDVPEVPIPATGVLLIGALGGLLSRRRWRTGQ